MRLKWLREQWNDVKGNVKFWLLTTIIAALVAAGSWTATRVEKIIHELPSQQREVLLGVYAFMFASVIATSAWAVASSKAKRTTPPIAITPPPLLPMPPPSHPKDVDLHIEIKEVLFTPKTDFMAMGSFYVLINLRITNRGQGSTEPAAIDWKLDLSVADSYYGQGKVAAIPPTWQIERSSKGGAPVSLEEVSAPSLDRVMQATQFKRATPCAGWVLFDVFEFQSSALPPYNAMLHVTITDSMGNEHVATKLPALYLQTGKIVTS